MIVYQWRVRSLNKATQYMHPIFLFLLLFWKIPFVLKPAGHSIVSLTILLVSLENVYLRLCPRLFALWRSLEYCKRPQHCCKRLQLYHATLWMYPEKPLLHPERPDCILIAYISRATMLSRLARIVLPVLCLSNQTNQYLCAGVTHAWWYPVTVSKMKWREKRNKKQTADTNDPMMQTLYIYTPQEIQRNICG